MTLTSNQLAALSLVLLALGLMAGAGALITAEVRRARSGKVIGRAIDQVVSATTSTAGSDEPVAMESDIELPFHWLDSRFGRALVADEDRNLIDQCGLPSKRTQLVFSGEPGRIRLPASLSSPMCVERRASTAHRGHGVGSGIRHRLHGAEVVRSVASLQHGASARTRSCRCSSTCCACCKVWAEPGPEPADHGQRLLACAARAGLRADAGQQPIQPGRSREHSLQRLATLHKNENLNGLVSLLVQVDKHGGAVQEPLRVFSDRLREHRRSEMKERIGKITVKMTAVMVSTLLPALVIVTAGPAFLSVFRSLGSPPNENSAVF
jgi:tight adherence protein C